MSASVIVPGTRLAGRYWLEDRVSEAVGSTMWRAVDEPLARAVAVRTFDPGFPRIDDVIGAARAASRVSDARLAQVFDADQSSEHPYVVSEWVIGESLLELLQAGPLDPDRAVALVDEAARAVTAAHARGLAHLCLDPSRVIWTRSGTVKVTGLGVDAALYGIGMPMDPSVADAQGLGALLFAALTAHWPGENDIGLPLAPRTESGPCSAHQVVAGIPGALDTLVDRALRQDSRRGMPPLTNPAEMADALAELPRSTPTPPPARTVATGGSGTVSLDERPIPGFSTPEGVSLPPVPPDEDYAPRRSVGRMFLTAFFVIILLAAIVVAGWQLGRNLGNRGGAGEPPSPPRQAQQVSVLPVSAPRSYDPPSGDGEESDDEVPLAVDDDKSSAWTTETYDSAEFGNLKEGVGLVFDMGKPVRVSDVRVAFLSPGSSVELGTANTLPAEPSGSSGFRMVDSADSAPNTVDLKPSNPVRARYILVWLTKLPPSPDGDGYQAQVSDVTIRGSDNS